MIGEKCAPMPIAPPDHKIKEAEVIYARKRDFRTWIDAAVTGSKVRDDAGFPVWSFIVDNHSNQYVYIEEVGRFILPYSWGNVLVGTGKTSITVDWKAPYGLANPGSAGGICVIIGYEDVYQPTPGETDWWPLFNTPL